MLIVHTADWHLGQWLPNINREAEQVRFLDWLARQLIHLGADVLLVAGDVFHADGRDEVAFLLLTAFLERLSLKRPHLQLVLIAGNHDKKAQFERIRAVCPNPRLHLITSVALAGRHLASNDNLFFLRDQKEQTAALCAAAPHLRPGHYEQCLNGPNAVLRYLLTAADVMRAGLPLIVVAHQRVRDQTETNGITNNYDPPISSAIFPSFVSYVALGHHHEARKISGRTVIRYAGPPFPIWPAEASIRQSVTVVKLDEDGKVKTRLLEMK
jgi:DNA repair protein SbcD/Mre11